LPPDFTVGEFTIYIRLAARQTTAAIMMITLKTL
jgi:hypothetical protein